MHTCIHLHAYIHAHIHVYAPLLHWRSCSRMHSGRPCLSSDSDFVSLCPTPHFYHIPCMHACVCMSVHVFSSKVPKTQKPSSAQRRCEMRVRVPRYITNTCKGADCMSLWRCHAWRSGDASSWPYPSTMRMMHLSSRL
jgi:hypothetical protein